MTEELFIIFISAAIVNNFVLTYFLGICPLFRTSGNLKSVLGMGFAVTFVMVLAAASTWPIYTYVLKIYNLLYIEYVVFVVVIAVIVEIIEFFIRGVNPELYESFWKYLSLIKTNCIVLGICLFMILKEYDYTQSLIFALGGGVGFSIILLIMAGIREELELADVPKSLKGPGIVFIVAGCIALSFMGFSSLPVR